MRALLHAARRLPRGRRRGAAFAGDRLVARHVALALAVACSAGSLTGCSLTRRVERTTAHIEEMNDRMAQLNDRVESLGKAVEKLDETNKRLGDLRDHAGVMAKQLGSIEKVARRFGGSASFEQTPTSIDQPEAVHPAELVHQTLPASEQTSEPSTPLGQSGPSLAEPVSSSSERPRPASEFAAPAPPIDMPVSATDEEPTPEAAEPKRVEHRVGRRVITLR